MIYAELQTRSFTFRIFGASEEHCQSLLKQAWEKHAAQTGSDPEYWNTLLDDINYLPIEDGAVYRDWHKL